MAVIDEVKLDKLYRKILKNEKAIVSEKETLQKAGLEYRRKLKKENREIKSIREKRHSELMQAANDIFDWLKGFAENPKGRKVLSTVGALVILCPTDPDGKLMEERDSSAWLSYDYKGVLRYRESSGGMRLLQDKVLTNPEQMVSRLHPLYVLSVQHEITTGKIWKLFYN